MKERFLSPDRLDRLRDVMAARIDAGELPGAVTLIADRADAYVDAIGVTAFGGAEPMRRDTVFQIASMTKPVVATAAMMLVEDGLLALGEPVDRLLPELADRRVLRTVDGPLDDTVPARRPITLEDLLTFRMGYGMVFEPSFEPPYPVITAAGEMRLMTGPPDPRTPHDPDEWMRRFGTLPLMYQPGERWQYNVSALVLGVLIARAAGGSLPDVLANRIFEPLGMVDTGFTIPRDQVDRMPWPYMTDFETGQMGPVDLAAPSGRTTPPPFPSGAAGLLSTADDYLAFARLLLGGGTHDGVRLLSEDSVRAMTTNHLTPEQIAGGGPVLGGVGWGYGMSVVTEPGAVSQVPGRYGWDGGYGTSWFNHPALGLTVIVLTQTADVLFNGTVTEFATAAVSGA